MDYVYESPHKKIESVCVVGTCESGLSRTSFRFSTGFGRRKFPV